VRIAVISDVHGNLHALQRVLEVVGEEGVDALWCLGDTVGYGPRPNECCALIGDRTDLCLAGNHDLLALGRTVAAGDFNPDASAAGDWTRSALDERSRRFLSGLEPQALLPEAAVFHASARDPVWEYVLSTEAARVTLELTQTPIVLVGHSHIPLAISFDGDTVSGTHAPAGTEVARGTKRWLLNPGSVGQPRDGDPRSSWLLLDLGHGTASYRRQDYAIGETQDEIRKEGLPEALAERLQHGF